MPSLRRLVVDLKSLVRGLFLCPEIAKVPLSLVLLGGAITRGSESGKTDELAGMPSRLALRFDVVGAEVVVSYGGRVLACYERGDRGMRNLAIVSVTRAAVKGVEVAGLFGVRPENVSRLRRQADEGGSAGLVPPMGRPAEFDAEAIARVHSMAEARCSGASIAAELGVPASTISRLLGRHPHAATLDLEWPEATIGSGRLGCRSRDGKDGPVPLPCCCGCHGYRLSTDTKARPATSSEPTTATNLLVREFTVCDVLICYLSLSSNI